MQPAIVPTADAACRSWVRSSTPIRRWSPPTSQTLDITRHEIAHIVTREATKGPFDIAGMDERRYLRLRAARAARGSRLCARSGHPRRPRADVARAELVGDGRCLRHVGLYYGQAGSIVSYLVTRTARRSSPSCCVTFKEGATPDDAFEQVYGFDQLGHRERMARVRRPRAARRRRRRRRRDAAQPTWRR